MESIFFNQLTETDYGQDNDELLLQQNGITKRVKSKNFFDGAIANAMHEKYNDPQFLEGRQTENKIKIFEENGIERVKVFFIYMSSNEMSRLEKEKLFNFLGELITNEIDSLGDLGLQNYYRNKMEDVNLLYLNQLEDKVFLNSVIQKCESFFKSQKYLDQHGAYEEHQKFLELLKLAKSHLPYLSLSDFEINSHKLNNLEKSFVNRDKKNLPLKPITLKAIHTRRKKKDRKRKKPGGHRKKQFR